MEVAATGKVLGVPLIAVGASVLAGFDRRLEALLV
jgi:hypothetical protein